MATERRWGLVSRNFTGDGNNNGVIPIDEPSGFHTKQRIAIKSDTQPNLVLEVKKVTKDQIEVGELKTDLQNRVDVSAYTTADNALVVATQQQRPFIKPDEIINAVYAREPAVAYRNLLVDEFGDPYRTNNPFPVQLSNDSINIDTVNADLSVQLTHFIKSDGTPADSTQIGDGEDVLAINEDGSINTTDFFAEVSKGNVPEHSDFNLNGFSETIGTAGATVWGSTGFYQFPTTAQTLEVFSANANDTSAGTGARILRIIGLDSNYDEIQEDVTLNGTNIVTTSLLFLRINEAIVISAGSSEFNEGNITIRNSTSQIILAVVVSRRSVAQQAVRTMPAGKKGIVLGGFISLAKNGLLGVIKIRSGTTGVVSDLLRLEIGQDRFDFNPKVVTEVGEKTDIWINANTKAGETSATAFLNIMLVG